jgi:hypothetical protein
MIAFLNETHILYEQETNSSETIQIRVEVDRNGDVASIENWVPHPDPAWPGYMDDASDHGFTLNVKFHDQPQSASILLLQKDDTYFNKGWLDFYDYGPVAADAKTLWTETFVNLEAGVYFLRLTNPGIRWATLTNRTHVFWDMDEDDFDTTTHRAEFYFVVKGWFGYTIPWNWTGNPPP